MAELAARDYLIVFLIFAILMAFTSVLIAPGSAAFRRWGFSGGSGEAGVAIA
jgi:hypothetical protein